MSPDKLFEVAKHGQTLEVKVMGKFDTPAARLICDQLHRLSEESVQPKLRLDMRNVAFVTGDAVDKLVWLRSQIKSKGGEITLHRVQPPIAEVFEVVKLSKLFGI